MGRSSGADHVTMAQRHRPLDDIFQFPDIARLGVVGQHGKGRLAEPLDLFCRERRRISSKGIHQDRNIFPPFRNGGNRSSMTFSR